MIGLFEKAVTNTVKNFVALAKHDVSWGAMLMKCVSLE